MCGPDVHFCSKVGCNMKNFLNKVAFITGAASGIGLELSRACGAKGMKVMLADIDQKGLSDAETALRDSGLEVATVRCDVTDPESIRSAAQATVDCFGKVHFLVNNAGVYLEGGAGELSLEKWRWVIDVNLMSVIYGVETFLPLIRAHDEGGHILNTASVAGLVGFAGVASYIATKHAVFGYSESLAGQLDSEGIGVSVLCPGFVDTRIADIDRYGQKGKSNNPNVAAAVSQGMSPTTVAKFTLEQVQAGALYILTHPGTRDEILERYDKLTKALDAAADSDIIMAIRIRDEFPKKIK